MFPEERIGFFFLPKLNRKHREGKKMSPALLSMTPWLKDLYVSELQNIYRTKRNLEKEVLLALEKVTLLENPRHERICTSHSRLWINKRPE